MKNCFKSSAPKTFHVEHCSKKSEDTPAGAFSLLLYHIQLRRFYKFSATMSLLFNKLTGGWPGALAALRVPKVAALPNAPPQ